MLEKINKFYPNNIGLYRDDGLAIFKDNSGPKSDRIRKHLLRYSWKKI